MKTKLFSCFLIFVLAVSSARAQSSVPETKKLQNTAKELRDLAQTKRNMAQNLKKESLRKQLLDGASRDEKLAAATEVRAREETALEKDPAVKAARLAEKKALEELNGENAELEKIKTAIQSKQGTLKERAANGERFMKKMKEMDKKQAARRKAAQKREAAEAEAKKSLTRSK